MIIIINVSDIIKVYVFKQKKMILVLVYECLIFLQNQFLSATQVIIIDIDYNIYDKKCYARVGMSVESRTSHRLVSW